MSIATLGDLKSTAATYLNRTGLTSLIPTFVQMAETRIAYGSQEQPFASRPLRIRAMEGSYYATISTQKVSLPTGYLAQRRIYINTNPVGEIEFLTPDIFWRTWPSSEQGQPRNFTVEGENFVFGPAPDTGYDARLLYYKKFTALSADGDTNWLLTNAPTVYLNGTLLEAYRYSRNPQMAQDSLNAFCGVVNSLNDSDKSDRYSSPWVAHTDTGNP